MSVTEPSLGSPAWLFGAGVVLTHSVPSDWRGRKAEGHKPPGRYNEELNSQCWCLISPPVQGGLLSPLDTVGSSSPQLPTVAGLSPLARNTGTQDRVLL